MMETDVLAAAEKSAFWGQVSLRHFCFMAWQFSGISPRPRASGIPFQPQMPSLRRYNTLPFNKRLSPNAQHVKLLSPQDVTYSVAMALAFARLTEILDQTLPDDTTP
jgi:hypothetical protein